MEMQITKESITTKAERIAVRIEDSKANVILDKEKETEAIAAIDKAAGKAISLNSKSDETFLW